MMTPAAQCFAWLSVGALILSGRLETAAILDSSIAWSALAIEWSKRLRYLAEIAGWLTIVVSLFGSC